MSGKPGRSGRKRLPVSQHLLKGTYRRDRHTELGCITEGGRKRLEDLLEAYRFTQGLCASLRDRAREISERGAPGLIDILKELRAQTRQLADLSSAMERLERQVPPEKTAEDSVWDEFLGPQ